MQIFSYVGQGGVKLEGISRKCNGKGGSQESMWVTLGDTYSSGDMEPKKATSCS